MRPQARHLITDVWFNGGWFVWEAYTTGYSAPVCRVGKARTKLSPRDRRIDVYGRCPVGWRRCAHIRYGTYQHCTQRLRSVVAAQCRTYISSESGDEK